jgi:murein DD-endopeptidase
MDKKFLIIVLILLFSVNLAMAQFNTVSHSPVIKKDREKPVPAADSLEWTANAAAEVQPDSISEYRENVNISLPLKHIAVSSAFGYRFHPVEKKVMFHAGIDLKAYYEPFYCFADGIVLRLGYDEKSGNYLVVSHGNSLETVYCHLSQIWVKERERVSAGQLLGITGNTGETTAPHLHFGMRWEGKIINPQMMIEWVIRKDVAL